LVPQVVLVDLVKEVRLVKEANQVQKVNEVVLVLPVKEVNPDILVIVVLKVIEECQESKACRSEVLLVDLEEQVNLVSLESEKTVDLVKEENPVSEVQSVWLVHKVLWALLVFAIQVSVYPWLLELRSRDQIRTKLMVSLIFQALALTIRSRFKSFAAFF